MFAPRERGCVSEHRVKRYNIIPEYASTCRNARPHRRVRHAQKAAALIAVYYGPVIHRA